MRTATRVKAPTLFLILLLLSFVSFSQSYIRGKVTDEKLEAITSATIQLSSRNGKAPLVALTNSEGHFEFAGLSTGIYRIRISFVGKNPVELDSITLNKDGREINDIILENDSSTLAQVVVRSSAPSTIQKKETTVVQVKDMISAAGGSALTILERVPGVLVNQQSNTISLFGREGVLIFINGKRSYVPASQLIQMLNGLNGKSIERIEITPNPSASQDADGGSGSINIILKESRGQGLTGSVSAAIGYGKGETTDGSFNIHYEKSKFSASLNYSFLRTNQDQLLTNYRRITNNGKSNEIFSSSDRFPVQRNHTLRLNLSYNLSKKTSIGAIISGYDNRWSMTATNQVSFKSNGNTDTLMKLDNAEVNHWTHSMFNVNLQHQFSESKKLNIDFDILRYKDLNPVNYQNEVRDASGDLLSTSLFKTDKTTPIRFKVASVSYSQKLSKHVNVETGIKMTQSRFENEVSVERFENNQWIKDPLLSGENLLRENIPAAFTLVDWKINSKTSVKAGLRYEYTSTKLEDEEKNTLVDREFGEWFPNFILNRELKKQQSFFIGYNRRITRPTFNDLAPFVIFIDPNTLFSGNASLQPAISNNFNAGFRIPKTFFSLQYTDERNSIARFQTVIDPQQNKQVFTSQNLDYSKTVSLSVSYTLNILSNWNFQNTLTGGWKEVRGSLAEEPVTISQANLQYTGSTTLRLPKKFSVEVSGMFYHGGLFGLLRLQSFGSLNAAVQKKIGKGSLTFLASDILQSNRIKTKLENENVGLYTEFFVRLTPRTFKLTYSINFGKDGPKRAERESGSAEERNRIL